jgi:hypothetical protein
MLVVWPPIKSIFIDPEPNKRLEDLSSCSVKPKKWDTSYSEYLDWCQAVDTGIFIINCSSWFTKLELFGNHLVFSYSLVRLQVRRVMLLFYPHITEWLDLSQYTSCVTNYPRITLSHCLWLKIPILQAHTSAYLLECHP